MVSVMADYLIGTMTVPAGQSINNLTTAVPFSIPVGADSIVVLASGSDCYADVKAGTSSRSTTASAGNSIGTSQYQLPCDPMAGMASTSPNVLAVFNNNVAQRTVQVWWIGA